MSVRCARVCVCVLLKDENEGVKTWPRLHVWPATPVLALIHVNLGVLNVGDEWFLSKWGTRFKTRTLSARSSSIQSAPTGPLQSEK